MCGVTALLLHPHSANQCDHLSFDLRTSLQKIQHRGYDGAGIALGSGLAASGSIKLQKGQGLVHEVLSDELLHHIEDTNGFQMGLAHTRYKTVGECSSNASQPLLNEAGTLCLVHNGQIVADAEQVPDSIKLLHDLTDHLPDQLNNNNNANLTDDQLCSAVRYIFDTVQGAYSCILMIQGFGLLAFRDPRGIRPLVYSQNAHGDHMFASEDIAIRAVGSFRLSLVQDVQPGECIIIRTVDAVAHRYQLIERSTIYYSPCIFEYIYLASHNTTMNGIDVKVARKVLGRTLANQIARDFHKHGRIDWIVPVPETSCIASQELASCLELPYLEVLLLNPNRKKARTFILPTQDQRVDAVKNKFTIDPDPVIAEKLVGSHILLVDDSIIRGTTLRCVIQMMRNAGVKTVTVASVAPAVRYKNVYGIDIPDDTLLIANGRQPNEIAQELGADRVIYQSKNEMVEAFLELGENHGIIDFECSLFDGKY